MSWFHLIILAVGLFSTAAQGDELDEPPATDGDPRCLERKAAQEAYLKSIFDAPVSKGKPCPPDPEEIREREAACRAERDYSQVWKLISDGFEADSSMLSKGVPYVVEILGDPLREEKEDGFWDIDIYEIPRTLYFLGVWVKTHDYVSDAVNFDLATGTVKPTNHIYEMRVEDGDFQFAHGLTLGSSREDVEVALGLPCAAVARIGRVAVRSTKQYGYADTSDHEQARYSIGLNFGDDGRVESIQWYYDSVWH